MIHFNPLRHSAFSIPFSNVMCFELLMWGVSFPLSICFISHQHKEPRASGRDILLLQVQPAPVVSRTVLCPRCILGRGGISTCSSGRLRRERWSLFPVFKWRSSDVSLHKVLEYVPQLHGGEGKWKHASATAAPKHPESFLSLVSACWVSPHALHRQFRYPNWSCGGRLEKPVQGLMLQNLKPSSCPKPVIHLWTFIWMLKKKMKNEQSVLQITMLCKNTQNQIVSCF